MKHRRSVDVVVLVAGIAVLDGGRVLHAMEVSALGQQMYAAAMGETHGRGAQGYIGIDWRDVSEDQLGALKLKEARGVEITNLDHDGPACKAGMRLRDVILQMNGQIVENDEQMRRMLKDMPVGRSVTFVISRDGQTQTMTMQTADRRTIGLQAWEQHYTVPAPGPSGVVRGNTFLDGKSLNAAPAQKEHRDLLGTETIILSSSFTCA